MYQRMADVIDVQGLQREVERRAGTNGVRCNFSKDVKGAFIAADGVMYLPALPTPFDMDSFRIIRMSYIHELAHWKNKRLMALRREYPVPVTENLGAIWNIIQDELDERLSAEAYPGDAKALGEGHAVLMYRQIEWMVDAIKAHGKLDIPEDDLKRIAAYVVAQSQRDWDTFSSPILIAMRRKLPPDAIKLADELLDEGWGAKITECRDSDAVVDTAKALTKRLWPESDPDKEMQDAKDKAQGKGKDKGKSKAGKGEGEEDEGEGEGKTDKREKINTELKVIPWERLMFQNHDMEGNMSRQASRIDWTGKHLNKGGTFKPASPDQYQIVKVYK